MNLDTSIDIFKKIILGFFGALLLYFFYKFLVFISIAFYNMLIPIVPPTPDLSYGKLNRPIIYTNPNDISKVSLVNDLPNLTISKKNISTAFVYKKSDNIVGLDTEEKFKSIVPSFGFLDQNKPVNKNVRLWTDSNTKKSFELDKFKETYTLNTDLSFFYKKFDSSSLQIDYSSLINRYLALTSQNFLKSSNLEHQIVDTKLENNLYSDLIGIASNNSKYIISYPLLDLNNPIDKKVEKLKGRLYLQNPSNYIISNFVYPFSHNDGRETTEELETILESNYSFTKYSSSSTYPIKTYQEALNEVLLGKRGLVSLKLENSSKIDISRYENTSNNYEFDLDTILIKDINLSYLSINPDINLKDNNSHEYYYPIYVVTGKFNTGNNLTGEALFYISAIREVALK